MTERKTLKSVSIDDVTPRVVLTPTVEVYGETCRIHHIKADSIAVDGRDTFVPLRHVSKQRRRIFELENENAKLRDLVADMSKAFLTLDIDHCQACPMDKDNCRCQMFVAADGECAFVTEMRELGIEVDNE